MLLFGQFREAGVQCKGFHAPNAALLENRAAFPPPIDFHDIREGRRRLPQLIKNGRLHGVPADPKRIAAREMDGRCEQREKPIQPALAWPYLLAHLIDCCSPPFVPITLSKPGSL
eukprot:scaffold7092_cov262-Pinguiococcus_pyrenoidosus.AAC.34